MRQKLLKLKKLLDKKNLVLMAVAAFILFIMLIPLTFILKLFLTVVSIGLALKIWAKRHHFFSSKKHSKKKKIIK